MTDFDTQRAVASISHDRHWEEYTKARAALLAVRAKLGRDTFKAQERFIKASNAVRGAQVRLDAIDAAERQALREAEAAAKRQNAWNGYGRTFAGNR
jgi:enoyl reductase-like protein